MNDEIKNILDEIEDYSKHEYLPPCCELTNEDCKQLLDYITNLQEELEEQKRIEQASLDTINNLQEEIERLKKDNKKKTSRCTERNHKIRCRDRKLERRNKKISKLEDYKSRNEKAIKHIKEHQLIYTSQYKEESNFDNHLLDILNGGDE